MEPLKPKKQIIKPGELIQTGRPLMQQIRKAGNFMSHRMATWANPETAPPMEVCHDG